MTDSPEPHPVVGEPILLSYIYHLLAVGFKYPTCESFEYLQSGQFMRDLFTYFIVLPHLSSVAVEEMPVIEKVYGDLKKIDFRSFETKYVRAFDAGFPEPPCPPYEGVYAEKATKMETMMEVSEFYRHFGLIMNQSMGKRELPDYLCAELEFMHFLALKEAQAGEGNQAELLNGYILAQKDFLERHFINWFPKFHEKVLGVHDLPFYPDLARITLRYINSEYGRVSKLAEKETALVS